ncbi:MAG: hypothetical protein QG656_2765, partial [Candidatus Hydrogenedentes bacterium]|nr:hypothetical protein [Candidatus Hydrogenedentota bacterium]
MVPIHKHDVVLFQGDSITDCGRVREVVGPNDLGGLGFGYAKMAGARLLAERPGHALAVYNRGVSGDIVEDLAARWRADCLDLRPSLLSVLIGVNDTFRQFDHGTGMVVARFKRVYRQILDEVCAARPGVKLVLCEPFVLECGGATEAHREEIALRQQAVRELVAEFGAQYVPFQVMFDHDTTEAQPEYWAPDGVHPTPAGHARMAEKWIECVLG